MATSIFSSAMTKTGGAAANPYGGKIPGQYKPSDQEIKGWIDYYKDDPAMIAKAVKDFGVGAGDIQRAGGYTTAQMGDAVKTWGNADLTKMYNDWAGAGNTAGDGSGTVTGNTGTSTGNNGTSTGTTGGSTSGSILESAQNKIAAESVAPTSSYTAPDPSLAPGTAKQDAWTAPAGYTSKLKTGGAQQVNFDETKSAAARTNAIMAEDSPLMKLAAAQGKREANSRGVLNSSAGIRASQDSVINRASDIGKYDAGLYSNTQLANMAEGNKWDLSLDERAQQESQYGRSLAESARVANQTNATNIRIGDQNFDLNNRKLSQDDKQFIQGLALETRKIDAQMEQFAQTYSLSVEQLEVDKDQLSQQDRQFYDKLKQDKDALEQSAKQFTEEWKNRAAIQESSDAAAAARGQADNASRLEIADRDIAARADIASLDARTRADIAKADNTTRLQISDADNLTRINIAASDARSRIDVAKLEGENRAALLAAEAKYKSDIASNENIAQAWGTSMSSIDKIQNNPDLDENAKNTLIGNTLANFQAFTEFWKKAGGGTVDVSDLLNFGPAGANGKSQGGYQPLTPTAPDQGNQNGYWVPGGQPADTGGAGTDGTGGGW